MLLPLAIPPIVVHTFAGVVAAADRPAQSHHRGNGTSDFFGGINNLSISQKKIYIASTRSGGEKSAKGFFL